MESAMFLQEDIILMSLWREM